MSTAPRGQRDHKVRSSYNSLQRPNASSASRRTSDGPTFHCPLPAATVREGSRCSLLGGASAKGLKSPISYSSVCPNRCNLTCQHRHSAVIISRLMHAEGLNDRLTTLTSLANLAHSLCAWLVAPNPCTLLSVNHNRGRRLPCSYSWLRYSNLSFSFPPFGPVPLTEAQYRQRAPRTVLVVQGGDFVRSQYAVALAAARNGTPFEWVVSQPIFTWMDTFKDMAMRRSSRLRESQELDCPWPPRVSLSPKLAGVSCSFVLGEDAHSSLALRLRDALLRKYSLSPGGFDAIHLRRRLDMAHKCQDTTVAAVHALVGRRLPNRSRPLVIYSDSPSAAYERELQRLLAPRRVVDADLLVNKFPEAQNDNFLVFAVVKAVAELAKTCFQLGYRPCGQPLIGWHRQHTWRP